MKCYEIEQKYELRNPLQTRLRLKKLGAVRFRSGRQDNVYFDYAGELKSKRLILRLRKTDDSAFLTLKGPRMPACFTKRKEFETPVDFPQTQAILTELGYRVYRRYRKHREEYRLAGCVVALDRIASSQWFLEIEGKTKQISRIAKQLGLTSKDREERSYLAILFPRDRIVDRAR